MERQKKITADGSHTIFESDIDVTYHSVYGAIQESRHVYIRFGLQYMIRQRDTASINILEIGFGTGLNALLTLEATEETQLNIHYHAIEPFPLSEQERAGLNYCTVLHRPDLALPFEHMHTAAWNKPVAISPRFTLCRYCTTLQQFQPSKLFNLVYYDAFAPTVQPQLWTIETFKEMFNCIEPGGSIVTYCSKGAVRRALTDAGFSVEKMPGPAHKREMIRAVKPKE